MNQFLSILCLLIVPRPVRATLEPVEKVDWDTTMSYEEAKQIGVTKEILCHVGMTTILEKFYIYPFDNQAEILVGRRFLHAIGGTLCTKERATSFFDGKCHQSFKTIKQETEGNGMEVNETTYIEPLYPFDCCIQTEVNRQLQTIVNPLREAKFWERTIRLLGTLLVNLEWKPCFQRCHSNEEEATDKWKIEIRLTDPYGNVYMQGFTTKKTTRRLSRYQKLSDIMSPNYTPN
ncbi:hypothetical protein Tco_0729683 [Tanacetum coccineum]|uniref:Uncharacterized protein n=1 Tax=Tanacetum coccineum TaxID=301880 RepID=A0ABQ4YQH3_9ASTR